MNRYIVQYHSRTLAALAGRKRQQKFPLPSWDFNYPNLLNCELNIVLHDNLRKLDNINYHKGLIIYADIKADSEEEAIDISSNNVESILSLISFCTLTFCESARSVSILSLLDDSKKEYPFKYSVYPFDDEGKFLGSLSVIDKQMFGTVFEAYDKSDEDSYKPRILRALSWLRKGLGESGSVDEFVCYWIGLETIKHLLSSEHTSAEQEWEEVEEIFNKRLNRQDFKKIKQAGRNGLLHGFRPVDKDFLDEIKGYVEPIRNTLIFCLGSVLGLEDDILLAITNKTPRRIRKDPWSLIEGTISGIPEDFGELVNNYPRIDAEMTNRLFSIDDKKEIAVRFKVIHHFHGPDGARFDVKATEVRGDKDSGIGHVEVKE